MGELSQARLGAVRRLIELAPDSVVRGLDAALAGGAPGDTAMTAVQHLISAEMLERRTRALVFAPLAPLCVPPRGGVQRRSFPAAAFALTWRGLRIVAADDVARAARAFATLRPDDELPEVFDQLCRRAAKGLRAAEEAFAPLAQALAAQGGDAVKVFADCLALVPLARKALARMPKWLRTLSEDHAAAIRLAFGDAARISSDAGPPFIEILFAHMDEPHEIVRLISLVMDKPTDRYLAASELASFGERLLDDVDRRIEEMRRFDPARGTEGGAALAGSVQHVTAVVSEFEQWLAINREGPWGVRLSTQKRNLAAAVEARLKEIEPAVGAALPFLPTKAGVKSPRGVPRLSADPDPAAVAKAQALLTFLCESRTAAHHGGFGLARTKVVEALDQRIDNYADDLIDTLHQRDTPDPDRVRAFLSVAAEFLGLVRDPKSAEIVRRRAAAA